MSDTNNELRDALRVIGNLYEEGKDCLNSLPQAGECNPPKEFLRLFEILAELRTIAALSRRTITDQSDN